MKIVNVTPENVRKEGLFCIKNLSNPGFGKKEKWFCDRFREGLRLCIALNDEDKPAAFIEYVPAKYAWRPVKGPSYMFIHCMMTTAKKDRNKGLAAALLRHCEEDAKSRHLSGMAAFCSDGSWLASKEVYLKNGFEIAGKKQRFELLVKRWDETSPMPEFIDWNNSAHTLDGWHLHYADQCPWHEKTVQAIRSVAMELDIKLSVHLIRNAKEAQNTPSGFGVFALVKDGELLADHYISKSRFLNILKKVGS